MSSSTAADVSVQTDRNKPMMVSALASFSMVLGCASCVLLVLVVPALITAVLAIVVGHIAVRHVRANQAELLGGGRAQIGLMLGYICLIAGSLLLPQMERGRLLVKGILASDRSVPAEDLATFSTGVLGEHERTLVNDQSRSGGSSAEAIELAQRLNRKLRGLLADVLELEDRKGFSWDPTQLRCHCHINRGVVFMVREPGLLGFNDAALKVLHHFAWQGASETVRDSGDFNVGHPIAVCIVGKQRSQTFLVGRLVDVNLPIAPPDYLGPDGAQVTELFRNEPVKP